MQFDGGLHADGTRRGLRLPDLVPVQRRADAGAAAHAHDRAAGAGLRDGRPHGAAALRLREPARHGQRHAADPARLVAARRVGAAELVRARVLHRRTGHRRRRRSGRVPAAPPDRTRARASCCRPPPQTRRLARAHVRPQQQGGRAATSCTGQGVAYARYVHSKWPGFGAAWSAWVADVEVNRVTGEVHVKRVVVGQDAGLMVNPAGVQHQVHGNVMQTTSRALKERVRVDPSTNVVASREWGSYPILSFREVPVIEVMTMPRPGEPPLGAGESSSVPGTAAIANAIFDATGVRFRAAAVHAGSGARRAESVACRRRAAARGCGRGIAGARAMPRRADAPWPRGSGLCGARGRCCWPASLGLAGAGLLGVALGDRAGDAARARRSTPPPRSSAAASSRPSATASSATPRRAACPMPAAARWRRRSAPSTAPT